MKEIKNILLIAIAAFAIFACEPRSYITSSNAGIEFSVDTLYFDTVFTELGTATRSFTIHNPHNEFIKISELRLAKGENSVFRINLDGVPGIEFEDIEIAPNDSLYVFVDATLDPNGNNEILLQQDSILTRTNRRDQDIDLVAWGQDVHLLRAETLETQSWVNDKPYLILDYIYVDTLETLTLEPGVQVYLHRDAIFAVGGSLIAEGNLENPIKFNGDRLESLYSDWPGQWAGIWFLQGSRDNVMDYCEIKGSTFGMIVDSVMNENPTLEFNNSLIQHVSSIGLLARGSEITSYNSVFANCGSSAIALTIGGSYEFNHCTIANGSGSPFVGGPPRTDPSVYISNYYFYNDTLPGGNVVQKAEVRDIDKANFGNCIIWGIQSNELLIDKFPDRGVLNYLFDHCLGRFDPTEVAISEEFFPNLINENPNFISWSEYNFQLDTLSPAKDVASLEISTLYPFDKEGNNRLVENKPDIGAYERIEE
jgi:hypothetical protein